MKKSIKILIKSTASFLFLGIIFIVGLSIYMFASFVTPVRNMPESSDVRFERLLGKPIPSSVKVIQNFGYVDLGGGSEGMIFTISEDDLNQLLSRQKYTKVKIKNRKFEVMDESFIGGLSPYVSPNFEPNVAYFRNDSNQESYHVLYVNEDSNIAVFYRFRL